jgi:hypothetical protein
MEEGCTKDMDPKYGVSIIIMPIYQDPLQLAPLTIKAKWRKVKIEYCLGEDIEEDLNCVLHCCLEEVNRC